MNKETIEKSQKAVEQSAKTAVDNANKVLDLMLNRSTVLFEKNVEAARATVERHSAYAENLKKVRGVEDLVKVQESISRSETEALEVFSRDVYELASKSATELAKFGDEARTSAAGIVGDSIESAVKAIPNGDANPYGAVFKNMASKQVESLKAFDSFVEKSIAAQQANFSKLADTVTSATAAAAKAKTAKK